MKGHRIGYVRVSSEDQNTDRQLEGVELDIKFTEHASGRDTKRPQLQAALKHARIGDTFIVHSMDRLSRNVEDMLKLIRELNAKGVSVQFMKENMDFPVGQNDPRAMLMLLLLSSVAQFERALIRERQREGIALAKKKGVYKGRKRALTPEQATELRRRVAEGGVKSALAREYGIHRDTLYEYIRS